uniref:RNA-directed DNA polymerase, eukaryota, reverse transcriptase zinc-binding domain protein n=1 Tax=Tanacetum cinerariifolium TaxID=118510 RepID=A0A699GXY4_TANCI|nr:RNA-directed DNA polymerase, eukaryota, reverse transcriptase zinc-binding domain protein [Tanacetum cinerariifolium]
MSSRLNIIIDNIGPAFMSTSKLNDSILWHARLGHVPFKRMQDVSNDWFLGKRGIDCIFVGYAEHSKAFKSYVIEPNASVLINSIIESMDAIFNENRFSSVLRPSLRVPNETKDIGGLVVLEEVTEEVTNLLTANRSLKVDKTIEKFKAKLVLQGFKQKSGIDYFDTFAPVVRISIIRLLIAMTSIHNLIIHQMDVKIDFLNDELDEVLYEGHGDADVILGTPHWQAIQRVLKYLRKTIDYRLTYTGYPLVLEGYTNASWISNSKDNSFTRSWVFLLGGGAISWASKKQTYIAGSRIESKFVALEVVAKAYSQMYNRKCRHLCVRHSVIPDLITNGMVSIEFVRSESNKIEKDHQLRLSSIDVKIDQGRASEEDFTSHRESMKILGEIDQREYIDLAQKANIKWDLEAQREYLESECSCEEIKQDVWNCGGDRAPGPGGFTFKFFTTLWDILEFDVVNFVSEFFHSGNFPKGCNSLSLVIGSVVSSKQSAFSKGRNILDGPLILNEVMAWYLSGLKININKCNVLGICVPHENVANMAKVIGCVIAKLHLKYLVESPFLISWWSPFRNQALVQMDMELLKCYLVLSKADLISFCNRKLGNGTSTRFWDNIWCGESTFKSKFLRVYMLDNDRDCVVPDWMHLVDWSSVLRRLPRGGVESSQFNYMLSLFRSVALSDKPDSWSWSLDVLAGFSVSSVRSFIDANTLDVDTIASRWNRFIPIKVNVFLWRLMLNRLPTMVN